ncbi:hypothetical protein SALBM135S_04338 [Streptomyces alboniger]
MRTMSYRMRAGAWGIAMDLTADAVLSAGPPGRGERVGGRVWLDASPVLAHPPADRSGLRILPEEVAWLRRGLALAGAAVEARNAPLHTTVTVHRVLFPLTDHQPEGFTAALLRWTEEEFGLEPRPVRASFDRRADRYVYDW